MWCATQNKWSRTDFSHSVYRTVCHFVRTPYVCVYVCVKSSMINQRDKNAFFCLPKQNTQCVCNQQRQAYEQRKSIGILCSINLAILWNVWNGSTEYHCRRSCGFQQVTYLEIQFVDNNPVHFCSCCCCLSGKILCLFYWLIFFFVSIDLVCVCAWSKLHACNPIELLLLRPIGSQILRRDFLLMLLFCPALPWLCVLISDDKSKEIRLNQAEDITPFRSYRWLGDLSG